MNEQSTTTIEKVQPWTEQEQSAIAAVEASTMCCGCFFFLLFACIIMFGSFRSQRDFEKRYEKVQAQKYLARQERIRYLEPLARKGDLIAFQEWKHLTGRHDIVDIRNIPDMTITGFSVRL